MLYLVCNTISRVDHARYGVPYAQRVRYMYLGTVLQFNDMCHWDQCYMRKEHKPKVLIQNQGILHCIKEGDVQRVNNG